MNITPRTPTVLISSSSRETFNNDEIIQIILNIKTLPLVVMQFVGNDLITFSPPPGMFDGTCDVHVHGVGNGKARKVFYADDCIEITYNRYKNLRSRAYLVRGHWYVKYVTGDVHYATITDSSS